MATGEDLHKFVLQATKIWAMVCKCSMCVYTSGQRSIDCRLYLSLSVNSDMHQGLAGRDALGLRTCTASAACTFYRGAGAGPAGTAATGPMLEAKLMNLIKGWLQKFWLSNNFSVKFTRSHAPAASPDQSWYASDATVLGRQILHAKSTHKNGLLE